MNELIERMRKLVNDNLVMGLRFQMNGKLNKLEQEIEQELSSRAERTCRNEWAEFGKFRCSECWTQVDAISTNTTQPMPIKYCPNCGCKVAGEPRTLEDVLRDVWKEALDYAKSDMWRNPDEVFAERAAEIRELLEVDA